MTELITNVHADIIEMVFAKVQLAPADGTRSEGRLYKQVPSAVLTAASEAWEKVRQLLNHAARKGWEAAQIMVDDVNGFIEQVANELQEEAEEFRALLLEKLHEVMRETVDFILRSVRSRVHIGDATYVLNSVELESKLVYSSSIEASVTALCKFIGQGETAVKGTYSLMGAEMKP